MCGQRVDRSEVSPIRPVTQPPDPDEGALGDAERKKVKETIIHTWEEETCTSYGKGLLMWHCFCNSKGVSEQEKSSGVTELTQPLWHTWPPHIPGRLLPTT